MSAVNFYIALFLTLIGSICGRTPYVKFSPGYDSSDDNLKRDLLGWLQKPVGNHHFPSPLQLLDEHGYSDHFYLDEKLAASQATCHLFKIEKRIVMDGLKFIPETIEEIYCINSWNPQKSTCPSGNMTCEQRYERVDVSWRKEGAGCWNDPMYYKRPMGCMCYIKE